MTPTTCATCRYAVHDVDRLACHRNPPPWPTVWPHNWCGEYQRNNNTKLEANQ
jgi:hypothetical protein